MARSMSQYRQNIFVFAFAFVAAALFLMSAAVLWSYSEGRSVKFRSGSVPSSGPEVPVIGVGFTVLGIASTAAAYREMRKPSEPRS